MTWNLADLVEAVNGVLAGELLGDEPVVFTSVSTDTRTLKSGALYIAIKGEHFDGHAFIGEAVRQGAVAVLISEPMETVVPAVLVDDTRIAFGQFAAWHRQQMSLKGLVGVTGSNGKTTTKALLAHILSKQAQVLSTQGNLNNDYGLPRTLLELSTSDDYAVIEMGANHVKEIAYLTQIAKPDVAVITLAAGAHLEGFGSLEGVIETKGEILDGVCEGGKAVLNTDSPGFEYWIEKSQQLGLSVITFGQARFANVQVTDFTQAENQITFTLDLNWQNIRQAEVVTMPVLGFHNAMNAAAATAACLALGLSWSEIYPGLGDFDGVAGRLQQSKLPQGLLIDDSYNANPSSVKAAIDALVQLPGPSAVCLGGMAELGAESEALHQDVAAFAKAKGVTHLLLFGEATQCMPTVFGEGAKWFESHEALAQEAVDLIQQDKIQNVLVKGSRSAKMEQVSQKVLARLEANSSSSNHHNNRG
uniref:UDP-N-acetylmuramoyl-tripeptide--D-alanyl-D-alanine ligase n=1 Tax=Hydrogenovibrio crunogenus (strain DSM 25203 / XCL-2) TaxID=317025 RepID=Q31I63_HYDCU